MSEPCASSPRFPLPEKLEKLKIDDEEDSDNDSTSEEEIEPGESYDSYQKTYRALERSKEIIKRFLKQVQENRFAKDMSMPYYPQPPVYTFMRLYVKDFQQHKVEPETGRKFLDQVWTS